MVLDQDQDAEDPAHTGDAVAASDRLAQGPDRGARPAARRSGATVAGDVGVGWSAWGKWRFARSLRAVFADQLARGRI